MIVLDKIRGNVQYVEKMSLIALCSCKTTFRQTDTVTMKEDSTRRCSILLGIGSRRQNYMKAKGKSNKTI